MKIKVEKEFSLLDFLEDMVGQMQMGKIDDDQALEIMSNVATPKITTIGDLQDKWHRERIQQTIDNYPVLARAYGWLKTEKSK